MDHKHFLGLSIIFRRTPPAPVSTQSIESVFTRPWHSQVLATLDGNISTVWLDRIWIIYEFHVATINIFERQIELHKLHRTTKWLYKISKISLLHHQCIWIKGTTLGFVRIQLDPLLCLQTTQKAPESRIGYEHPWTKSCLQGLICKECM